MKIDKKCEAVSPVIGVILVVAITVVLAAVIGTFVLGLGESLNSEPARAGISIDAGEDNVELTVVNTGNLEAIRIVAPDGTRSPLYSSSEGVLRTGMEIELQDGGFAPSSIEPAVEPDGGAMNLVNGDLKDSEGPKYDVPGEKQNQLDAGSGHPYPSGVSAVESECKVQVPGVIKGIDINGRDDESTNKRPDVGCSFQNLEAYLFDFENYGGGFGLSGADPLVGETSDPKKKLDEIGASGRIRYMNGEYKILGMVNGDETVVTSFEVKD